MACLSISFNRIFEPIVQRLLGLLDPEHSKAQLYDYVAGLIVMMGIQYAGAAGFRPKWDQFYWRHVEPAARQHEPLREALKAKGLEDRKSVV